VPARYFITILRGVILRGTGPSSYWLELVALGVFAILTMGVARARLKKVRL
jgi:ABC-type multidrug transport system permease subunit